MMKKKAEAGMAKVGATRSDVLVLFGVSGDLAHKKIFPALYAMEKRGALKVPVIGVASSKWSLDHLRKRVTDSIKEPYDTLPTSRTFQPAYRSSAKSTRFRVKTYACSATCIGRACSMSSCRSLTEVRRLFLPHGQI